MSADESNHTGGPMIKDTLKQLRSAGFVFKSFRFTPPMKTVPISVAGVRLPKELKNLLRRQFGSATATYYYEAEGEVASQLREIAGDSTIGGGPVLLSPKQMEDCIPELFSWAKRTWVRDDKKEANYWTTCLPFCPMGNGDYLGLSPKGKVIYLNHEDRSFVLAESFGKFWATWERLYFIGPEWWFLESFSSAKGRLNPRSANVRRFRATVQGILSSSEAGASG